MEQIHKIVICVSLMAICTAVRLAAAEPATGTSPQSGNQVGSVEGRVIYQADPQRPWRYARYYVKNRKSGELAEAVVAVSGLAPPERGPDEKPVTAVMDQKDFQFVPETLAIRTGDSVRFLNSDKVVHNVQTFHLRQSFNVSMAAGGEHVEKFKHASGIRRPYRIGCTYHSAMRAWIFVFDEPWFAMTQADGKFRLQNVPAGECVLEMVHPAGELRWRKTIQVDAGKTTRIDITVSPDDLVKQSSN